MDRRLLHLTAFVQRMSTLGSRRFGENLQLRSLAYLTKLELEQNEDRTTIALINLSREVDLYCDEDAALEDSVLDLHLRIIDLADRFPEAQKMTDEMLCIPPIARLCSAIIRQARADRASEILLKTSESNGLHFDVVFTVEMTEVVSMTVPSNLWRAVRGFFARLANIPHTARDRYFLARDGEGHGKFEVKLVDDASIQIALQ